MLLDFDKHSYVLLIRMYTRTLGMLGCSIVDVINTWPTWADAANGFQKWPWLYSCPSRVFINVWYSFFIEDVLLAVCSCMIAGPLLIYMKFIKVLSFCVCWGDVSWVYVGEGCTSIYVHACSSLRGQCSVSIGFPGWHWSYSVRCLQGARIGPLSSVGAVSETWMILLSNPKCCPFLTELSTFSFKNVWLLQSCTADILRFCVYVYVLRQGLLY